MALEIELKVFIDDFEKVETRLSKVAAFTRSFHKRDQYYTHNLLVPQGQSPTLFRVRLDDGETIVTHKTKKIQEGIETSVESEFKVDKASSFQKFMEALGFFPYIDKEKVGVAYAWRGMNLELSRVTGLGTFLEVEKLLEDGAGEGEQKEAQNGLLDALRILELSPNGIEARPYTQMLKEAQGNSKA